MIEGPAPFDHETADAPDAARAVFARSDDGLRLRLGHLGPGSRGTVLLIPGRTEYIEKYGRAAADLAARGYGTVSLDYRGQGLADRTIHDRRTGHVPDFADYQRDLDAALAFMEAEHLPRPWVMLAHSLGGAIGLRALTRGLPVSAAVFSAPMWGIALHPALRPVAWGLGWSAHTLGREGWVAPGAGRQTYVLSADALDNLLTTDPEMFDYMRRHLAAQPDLELAGPSVTWVYRALRECRALQRVNDPGVPTLTVVPGDEAIVCPRTMRRLSARWPRARALEVEGGRHETMMETLARRTLFFDAAAAFFAEASGNASEVDPAEGIP